MSAFVKGASKNPFLEKIVGLTWIVAFHLRVSIWFEWVDGGSNWSDDLSREFDQDELSVKLGFSPVEVRADNSWWQRPWEELWYRTAWLLKDQALED